MPTATSAGLNELEGANMITYWQIVKNGLLPLQSFVSGNVINVVNPTAEEINILKNTFKISEDFLTDIMDIDERSRMESEDDKLYIIYRVPFYNPDNGIPYATVPLGIIISEQAFIVIAQHDNALVSEIFASGGRRISEFNNHSEFLLNIINHSTNAYLRYLKQINYQTNVIEKDLEKSTKNKELHKLLIMEKCLVYFTTSLRSNLMLINKIKSPKHIHATSIPEDDLDDAIIEITQAIEMTKIYSDILSGMMDSFASVISNNLNIVMKQLTVVTIVLMIPTLVSSFFGMNVPNALESNNYAFFIILILSILLSVFGVLLIRTKKWI